jgi:hypothetical protein
MESTVFWITAKTFAIHETCLGAVHFGHARKLTPFLLGVGLYLPPQVESLRAKTVFEPSRPNWAKPTGRPDAVITTSLTCCPDPWPHPVLAGWK